MVQWMDRRTETFTHMGAEGITWMGISPFTTEKHHLHQSRRRHLLSTAALSRSAQAVAAKINITYKLLYNQAVAMTGGQQVDGELSLGQLVQQIRAEGVQHITVSER